MSRTLAEAEQAVNGLSHEVISLPTDSGSTGTEFGSRLRQARRAQGLTLREVANASGISVTYLSDLERGALKNPTLDTLTAVVGALNISVNELLGVSEQVPKLLPPALEEFRSSIAFVSAIEGDAVRDSVDPGRLEAEWLKVLASLRVLGRTPKDKSDYQFAFEALRRALGSEG